MPKAVRSEWAMTDREFRDPGLVEETARLIRRQVPGRCLTFEPLSRHTSWRVGGPASLFVYPSSPEAVAALVQICRERALPWFVIGYGTNLLAADAGFAGCVINLNEGCRKLQVKEDTLVAGGGVWLNDVVTQAASAGLQGMEKLAGIPGGLGGGLSMNCGAFGGAISDHLIELTVVEPDGRLVRTGPEGIGFAYRAAPGLVGKVVVEATFRMPSASPEEIRRAGEATITERFRRNVMTLPSAGSVFKNPPGMKAAQLIDSAGCKGMTVGGVEVSRLHANFIVNARGGTAADIAALIRMVRQRVKDAHGVELQLEVRTLGVSEDELIE